MQKKQSWRDLSRVFKMDVTARATDRWKMYLTHFQQTDQLLELAVRTLTREDGVRFVSNQSVNDEGGLFDPIFEALAKEGTMEQMMVCLRLAPGDEKFALYLTWFWDPDTALKISELTSANDALVIAEMIWKAEHNENSTDSARIEEELMDLFEKGETNERPEMRLSDDQVKWLDVYFPGWDEYTSCCPKITARIHRAVRAAKKGKKGGNGREATADDA